MNKYRIILLILTCFAINVHAQEKFSNVAKDSSNVISENKNGKWEWFYDNGQLGELGFYKDGAKDGEWKWYFKNGALKAIGNYKDGKPEGARKWYYSHDNELYCTGHYNEGEKDGEWKWYSENGEDQPKITINFNKDNVEQYTVFGKQGEELLKQNGSNATQVRFEESNSYLGVFGLFIDDKNNYELGYVHSHLYFGKYKDGKAEGERRTYRNDETLDVISNYRKGKLHGKFEQYTEAGILRYVWTFKNGEKRGLYQGYYETGEIENVGVLKNGKQVGKWKLYHKNGQIKNIRKYRKGKLKGKYSNYFDTAEVEEKGKYSNGKKEGQWLENHENGKPRKISFYKNGQIDGEWTEYSEEGILESKFYQMDDSSTNLHKTYFHPNGQLRAIGSSKKSLKDGVWKVYYEDGALKEVANYKDGQEDGKRKLYYNNGQLKLEAQFVNGERDGKFIWYKEDGKIESATEYKHDSRYIMGEWKYYDNGQLMSVELYEREELVEWKYYYDTGQLKELRQYHKKRTRTGEWKYFYKSGQLRLIAHYKDDQPFGEFKLYHKNGQLYKTQVWSNYQRLIEINSCFDAFGNALNMGTLINGTGTVYEYNSSGDLINSMEYVDGKPVNNTSIEEIWQNSSALNSLAWRVYEKEDDKEQLNFAISWVKQAMILNENFYNTDTYAALLYKTGKYNQALSAAEKAIKLAQDAGHNFNSTENLIQRINKELKPKKLKTFE